MNTVWRVKSRDDDPHQRTGDRASYAEGYGRIARGYVSTEASSTHQSLSVRKGDWTCCVALYYVLQSCFFS